MSVPQVIEVTVVRPGSAGAAPPIPAYAIASTAAQPVNGGIKEPGAVVARTPAPIAPAGGSKPAPATPLGAPRPSTRAAHFRDTYFLTGGQVFAVRVEKATYQVAGYAIDPANYYYCHPSEKFLLLTMRVKNVSAQAQPFDYQTITASVATGDGSDLPPTKNWKALDTNRLANRTVAPGEEVVIEGVVTVPAEGSPRTLLFGDCAFDLGGRAERHRGPSACVWGR